MSSGPIADVLEKDSVGGVVRRSPDVSHRSGLIQWGAGILALLVLVGPSQAWGVDPVAPLLERKAGSDTWESASYAHVERQSLENSCGVAALATLLRFYWGVDTSEADLLKKLEAFIPKEEWSRKSGLSVADLVGFARMLGYWSEAFRGLRTSQLARAGPVLLYVEALGFGHFVVYRKTVGSWVYLADPAYGNVRVALPAFERLWKGRIVVALEVSGRRPLPLLDVSQAEAAPAEDAAVRSAIHWR